jgi:hypothetical protein
VLDLIDAPLLVIAVDGDWLDGVQLGSRAELQAQLRNKHQLWRMLNPESAGLPTLLLEADGSTPAGSVRSAMRAGQAAGFRTSFVVRRVEKL